MNIESITNTLRKGFVMEGQLSGNHANYNNNSLGNTTTTSLTKEDEEIANLEQQVWAKMKEILDMIPKQE